MKKKETIDKFGLGPKKIRLMEALLHEIGKTNKSINLVGKSTLAEPWDRHICDSLQITQLIKNKNSSILDMGTGAGLPGVVLSIMDYKNITMVDSKQKKIDFIKMFLKKHKLESTVLKSRIEDLRLPPFQYITSRALAPLYKLFNYSLFFSNRNTRLVFLKGRNVNKEIIEAKRNFVFNYKLVKSNSSGGGYVIIINSLKKND